MAEPLKGTFFAFRRRERRGVLWRATLVHAVLQIAVFAAAIAVLWSIPAPEGVEAAEGYYTRLYQRLGAVAVTGVLHLFVTASYEAACLRWLIRTETAGFGGFSLGGDTWRVFGGSLIWAVTGLIIWVGVMIAVALISTADNLDETSAFALFLMPVVFGSWALIAGPLAIRQSAGNAASVAKKKFAYFDGWKVSRERFWALLGSFLIVWTIWVVVFLAAFATLSVAVFSTVGATADNDAAVNVLMSGGIAFILSLANFVFTFFAAGINGRAVLAAVEEGKLEGVGVSANVAEVFA